MNLFSAVLAAEESGSPLGILILIVPFGLLIWLMVMPQRKQRQKQQQLISALDVGDEVITAGGIVGVITFMEDDLVHLEVDHDVVIRVAKSSISRSTAAPDPATEPRKGLLGGLLGGGAAAEASATKGGDAKGAAPSGSKAGSSNGKGGRTPTPARGSAKKK